jgi:hypothetical protein
MEIWTASATENTGPLRFVYRSRKPEALQANTKRSRHHKGWNINWKLHVQAQWRYIPLKA